MRIALPVALVLLLFGFPSAHAAFYQWTDDQGVVHFTDKGSNIPAKYRKKAKKVNLLEEPSAVKVNRAPAALPPPQGPGAAAPAVSQPEAPMPGGHPEPWWRDQYTGLRTQIKLMQDGIAEKQQRLLQLRRKRAIYQRAQDRVAVNAAGDDIAADQAKLSALTKQLDELEQSATRAAVPMEWRQ